MAQELHVPRGGQKWKKKKNFFFLCSKVFNLFLPLWDKFMNFPSKCSKLIFSGGGHFTEVLGPGTEFEIQVAPVTYATAAAMLDPQPTTLGQGSNCCPWSSPSHRRDNANPVAPQWEFKLIFPSSYCPKILSLFHFLFLAVPVACRSSQARDWTCATAATWATAVTTLDP